MNPGFRITSAIGSAPASPALVAFLTAGFPSRDAFRSLLERTCAEADVVEVGVPFTDPMADGLTIQRASRVALDDGVTLAWILDEIRAAETGLKPVILMSYLNPLIAYGFDRLAADARASGIEGFIVPDLPLDECEPLRDALNAENLALIQLVSPVTPQSRIEKLCAASQGFVYAVTVTGTTGGHATTTTDEMHAYLERISDASQIPVCAGFGVRDASQAAAIARSAEGVIVGSALIEAIESGQDPAEFLGGLRPETEVS